MRQEKMNSGLAALGQSLFGGKRISPSGHRQAQSRPSNPNTGLPGTPQSPRQSRYRLAGDPAGCAVPRGDGNRVQPPRWAAIPGPRRPHSVAGVEVSMRYLPNSKDDREQMLRADRRALDRRSVRADPRAIPPQARPENSARRCRKRKSSTGFARGQRRPATAMPCSSAPAPITTTVRWSSTR